MSFGLPPAGSTPAEEWSSKVLKAVDGALDHAGATASTGGFVDAAPRAKGSSTSGLGDNLQHDQSGLTGGLASGDNVQLIAAQAKLARHSEGSTREELLKGLSGREQAAAQLAAANLASTQFIQTNSEITQAKASSGPVNASSQVTGNAFTATASPLPATSSGLTRTVGVEPEPNDTKMGLTSAFEDRSSGPTIARLVDQQTALPKQDSGSSMHDVATFSSTGHKYAQPVVSKVSVPVEDVPVQTQQIPQPKLPDLMPSRNAPVDTPMVEGLPGGWIGSLKTSVPGADREHPETTVYQDVVTGLDSVGHTAFNAIPQSLKDSINPNRPHSGPSILDQARSVLGQVHLPQMPNVPLPQLPDFRGHSAAESRSQAISGDISGLRREEPSPTRSVVQASPTDLLNQARGMAADLLSGTRSRAEEAYNAAQQYADRATGSARDKDSPKPVNVVSHATSLPSQETQGQRSGEHTDGAGALPGSNNETGVAVLPAEKSLERNSAENAVAPKEPGLEKSATNGVLSISGDGQSIQGASDTENVNLSAEGQVTQSIVPGNVPESDSDVGSRARSEQEERPRIDLAHSHNSSPQARPMQGTNLEPRETAKEPISAQTSTSEGIASDTSASGVDHHSAPPVGGFALAPPLGVFTDTTPIAGSGRVVLPGHVLPAKTEAPVEVMAVAEVETVEPVLRRPAADAEIASKPAVGAPDRLAENFAVNPPIAGYTASYETTQAPEIEPELQPSVPGAEQNRDIASFPTSRDTSIYESDPIGKLDHPSAARMDSSASVTAIKHGHLGENHHKGVEGPYPALDTVSEKALPPPPRPTEDLAIARDVTIDRADPVLDKPAVKQPSTTASNTLKVSNVTSDTGSRNDASQHHRTASAVSTSSKKKGFFSKLKDKLHHDDK